MHSWAIHSLEVNNFQSCKGCGHRVGIPEDSIRCTRGNSRSASTYAAAVGCSSPQNFGLWEDQWLNFQRLTRDGKQQKSYTYNQLVVKFQSWELGTKNLWNFWHSRHNFEDPESATRSTARKWFAPGIATAETQGKSWRIRHFVG